MTTPTPSSFEELKNQLSAEKSKPKHERNKKAMESLYSQINELKKALKARFKKRMKEKHKEEVADRLRLEQKRNLLHKKFRDKKMKAKLKEKEQEENKKSVKTKIKNNGAVK